MFDRLLAWLEKNLPTAFAVGMTVYNYMHKKLRKASVVLQKEILKRKKLENRNEIEERNRNKSNSDIVRDAIREGRRSLSTENPEPKNNGPDRK